MSTAARKARKRSGEPFVRVPKVATPLHEQSGHNRRWFNNVWAILTQRAADEKTAATRTRKGKAA